MGEQIADRHNPSRQLKVNEDGSIDVTLLNGDIEIGAVEIKDGESDTRQKVKTDGVDNAAVVTQNSQPLPTGAATSDNQTNGTQEARITDGTNTATVNSDGQLHTVLRGKQDTGNSTTTPLLANASFVGTSIDTLDFSTISIVLHTDKDSAINGLEIDYSADNSIWHEGEAYTIEAGATKFFTPTLQARYVRVSYTNGTSDQTDFHIHTVLRKSPIKWSSHNIDATLSDEDDGELNISVIKLKTSKDNYVSAAATNGGNFKVSIEELESGVSSNSNSQLNVTQFKEDGTEGSVLPDGASTAANQATIIANQDVGTVTEGNITKQEVQDNNSEALLEEVVKQLKIMNLHLSILTDTVISKSEVE